MVNTHSINKTAANYYMTRQSASHALDKLEQEIGLTLFERSRNGVVLTAEGKIAAEHLAKINSHYIELLRLRKKKGKQIITLQFPIIYTLLSQNPNFQGALQDSLNNLGVRTQINDNDEIARNALDPEENTAYVFYTFSETPPAPSDDQNQTQFKHIVHDQIGFLLNRKHPLATKGALSDDDLLNWPLAVFYPYVSSIRNGSSFFGVPLNPSNIEYTPFSNNAILQLVKSSTEVLAPLPQYIINYGFSNVSPEVQVLKLETKRSFDWWYAYSNNLLHVEIAKLVIPGMP